MLQQERLVSRSRGRLLLSPSEGSLRGTPVISSFLVSMHLPWGEELAKARQPQVW